MMNWEKFVLFRSTYIVRQLCYPNFIKRHNILLAGWLPSGEDMKSTVLHLSDAVSRCPWCLLIQLQCVAGQQYVLW